VIIVDSGFLYALMDRRDAWHPRAMAQLPTQREGWVTTWPVLTEAMHLIAHWVGPTAAHALAREVEDGAIVAWQWAPTAQARLGQLMERYAGLPADLADASLLLLAEHLGHGRILSTDERDWGARRFKGQAPFQNLMSDAR